jgi:hypothetical protein
MSTIVGHPHIKVTEGGISFEPCEDPGCAVGPDGLAGCGRAACPVCGCGGANLVSAGDALLCSCGHAWRSTS